MKIANTLKNVSQHLYSSAILATTERKTCTVLANEAQASHDKMYQQLNPSNHAVIQESLVSIAQEKFGDEEVCLSVDDSRLNKDHACEIEGIDLGHDGSSGRNTKGLQMVTAMLTDLRYRIPATMKPFISKWLAGDHYQSKSEIAWNIINVITSLFNVKLVLADAHYSTKELLNKLFVNFIPFLMKFSKHKKVTIDGKHDQLQKLLRLRRNERSRCVKGFFEGYPCYFYLVKHSTGRIVYFISSECFDRKEIAEIYRIRWGIELFHRTAKQKLGWNDCQSRSLQRQVLHGLFVMHAYALADILRVEYHLKNAEESIKAFRGVKYIKRRMPMWPSEQNFQIIA